LNLALPGIFIDQSHKPMELKRHFIMTNLNSISFLKPIILTAGMLIVYVASSCVLSVVLFSDLTSAHAILSGDTLTVDHDDIDVNPMWTQLNVEFRNLSLSQSQVQGVEMNCEVHLGRSVPFILPPLSKCNVPIFVSQHHLKAGRPIVFNIDGKPLVLFTDYHDARRSHEYPQPAIEKVADVKSGELLSNPKTPLTSILEN